MRGKEETGARHDSFLMRKATLQANLSCVRNVFKQKKGEAGKFFFDAERKKNCGSGPSNLWKRREK